MQPFYGNVQTSDQQPAAAYSNVRTATAPGNGGPIQDPYHGQSPHVRGRADLPRPPPMPPPPPHPPTHHAGAPAYNVKSYRQGSLQQPVPQAPPSAPHYAAQQGNWNRTSAAVGQPFRHSPPTGTNYPPPPPYPPARSQTLNQPTHAATIPSAPSSQQHQGYPPALNGPAAPNRHSTLQHQPAPYNSEISSSTNPYYNSDPSPPGASAQYHPPKPPLPARSKSKYVPEYAQPGQAPPASEYAVGSPVDIADGLGRHAHRTGSNNSNSNSNSSRQNHWHHSSHSISSGSNGASVPKPQPGLVNSSASQQSNYARSGSMSIPTTSPSTTATSSNSLPYPETSSFPNPAAWRLQDYDGRPSSSPGQRRQSFGAPSFGSSGMSPNLPRRRKSLSNSNRPVSPLVDSPTPFSLKKGLARGSSVSSVSSERSQRTSSIATEGRTSSSALGAGAPSDWEYYAPTPSADDVEDSEKYDKGPVELPANDYFGKIKTAGGGKDGLVMHELPAEPVANGSSQGPDSLLRSQKAQSSANPKTKAQPPGVMEAKPSPTDRANHLGASTKTVPGVESSKLVPNSTLSPKPTIAALQAARDEASRSPRPKPSVLNPKPSAPKLRAKDVIPDLDDWYQDSLDSYIQALRDESFAPDGPDKRKAFIEFVMYESELRNLPIPWEESLRFDDGSSDVGHTETRSHESEMVKNSIHGQRGPKTTLDIPTTPIERIDEDDEEYSPGGRPIIPRPPFGANRPAESSKSTGNTNANSAANSETSSQPPVATPTSSKFDESSTVAPSPLKHKGLESETTGQSSKEPLRAFVASPENMDEGTSNMFPMPLAPRPKCSTPGPSSKPPTSSPATETIMSRLKSLLENLPGIQNPDEHPLVHHVNSTLSAIPDSEPFLRSIRLAFGYQERDKREKFEAERQERQDKASRLNDELFDDNEITFAQLKEREKDEKQAEAARIKDEEHGLYEEYATQVFEKSYARLHDEIGVAMQLLEELDAAATAAEQRLKKDSSAAEASTTSTSADSYSANPPTLSTCAKILCSIHSFLAARHALVAAAVSARDGRYARSAFAPANAAGDQAKLKALESHFGHAQAEAALRASKEALELAKGIDLRCGEWVDLSRSKAEEWMASVASALEELAKEKIPRGEIEAKVLDGVAKGIEAWTQELALLICKNGDVTREVRRKEGVMKVDKATVDGLSKDEKTKLEEQAKSSVEAVEGEVERKVDSAVRFDGARERLVKALDGIGARDHVKRAKSVLAEPRIWIGK
ncbi:hypothetical protein IWX49DRAFT_616642 [Phyllosticta citricarpa]|uniref:Uncharacterized protein n=1 Tax=Phyllosticta citricarpa TaxID=55181 RepID=A0ABR1MIW3_9PEZI